MKPTVTLDIQTISELAGWGDGYMSVEDGDVAALAANAFSSMARRMYMYQSADGMGIDDVLSCEYERCTALAKVFGQLSAEGKAKAKGSEQEGNADG